jgi:hypothetical protein
MIETVIALGILLLSAAVPCRTRSQGLSVDAMLLKKPLPMAKAVKARNSSTADQEITLLLIARGGDCFKRFYALPRHLVSQSR